jgi:hypothetical protein
MAQPKYIYRKRYDDQFEAEKSADGFARFGNIDEVGSTKVWVQEDDNNFYVYVELSGEMDPKEVLEATGFERISL